MKKLIYVQVFNYACFHYGNGKDIFGIDTYNLPKLKVAGIMLLQLFSFITLLLLYNVQYHYR